MRIALDARPLAHAESGIGNYTVNLVRALLAADPDLELLLICRTTPAQAGLQDPRITVVRFPFHPMSPATQYALPARLRPYAFDLFHAPFEVVPYGLRQPLVVTVHDLNWLVNPRYNVSSLPIMEKSEQFLRVIGIFTLYVATIKLVYNENIS